MFSKYALKILQLLPQAYTDNLLSEYNVQTNLLCIKTASHFSTFAIESSSRFKLSSFIVQPYFVSWYTSFTVNKNFVHIIPGLFNL